MQAQNIAAQDAQKLILAGTAPAGMFIDGYIEFTAESNLTALPDNVTVKHLVLDGCQSIRSLPKGLHCYELSVRDTQIETLPEDIQVEYRLDLSGCTRLRSLPRGLSVGSLIARGCTALRALPEGLDVYFLDITDCQNLESFPRHGSVRGGKLIARNCPNLRALPNWLSDLAQLDVSGCAKLTELPDGLRVSSWLDVANTQIQGLPPSLHGARLRWRSVYVDERVVFRPETLTAAEILAESNAEVRRVMLERKGYEAFMREADAKVIHHDIDPGGVRRLLHVTIPGDEPLVCLAVVCPSTGRQYLLRVPPTMRKCRQAAAWIAGFDNPADYYPFSET